MDRGGIAKAGRGPNVVGGEPYSEMAADVSDDQVAAAIYSRDGPAVSVFDPVGWREAESAVVGASDDHVADTGWRFASEGVVFTGASSVKVIRYRYRGSIIRTPWTPTPAAATSG
jgi:hypothetical protein